MWNFIGAITALFAVFQDLYILPWITWHSEIWIFAFLIICWGHLLIVSKKKNRRHFEIANISWWIGVLATVCIIQCFTGQIGYVGDALVIVSYLLLMTVSLNIAYNWPPGGLMHDMAQPFASPINQIAVVILFAGLVSALLAFVQVFDVWESAQMVLRIPGQRRPGANLGQPNQLATLLIFSLVSVNFLFEKNRLGSMASAVVSAVLLAALAMTESRTGALGLLVLAVWWKSKRSSLRSKVPLHFVALLLIAYGLFFWWWPVWIDFIHQGGAATISANKVNLHAGTRLVVWPQLWQATIMHPWFGWGIREVAAAHNAVLHNFTQAEPFSYAHNVILELLVGIGIPLTIMLTLPLLVWAARRIHDSNDSGSWFCLAIVLQFAVHSLFEFPFAYAYFLVPVFFLIGILERHRVSSARFHIQWKFAFAVWVCAVLGLAWSVMEYINIEEDFRVARFEVMQIGRTPPEYNRPDIYMLTQLGALLDGARRIPEPAMSLEGLEQTRKLALRFPWPATQNRYALSLALNGNPDEAIRQLKVMRAMHGEKSYKGIRANWEALADGQYPQLKELKIP
jgi:O-antigen ligase